MSELGERLRHAADEIAAVAEDAPPGDFDEETLRDYENEFGEVPELPSILREVESTVRHLSILTEAHEERDEDER